MSGQLCLRWNNHAIAFNKLLHKIYLEDGYSDATILCQGMFYPVHRFVLSTCSDYFEEMFRQCVRLNNKHPFIIIKDIHPDQMVALLNYMYKGEVNVPQEMLPELIKAAEAFKVKGLAVSDEEESAHKRKCSNAYSSPPISKKSRKNDERSFKCTSDASVTGNESNGKKSTISSSPSESQAPSSLTKLDNDAYEQKAVEIKCEPVDPREPFAIAGIENNEAKDSSSKLEEGDYDSYQEDSFNYDASNDHFNEGQESTSWDNSRTYEGGEGADDDPTNRTFEDDDDNIYPSTSVAAFYHQQAQRDSYNECPYSNCFYKSKKKCHLKEHIRTHTGEKPFQCLQCPYRAAAKSNLNHHFKNLHATKKPHICPNCSYEASSKQNLIRHTAMKH